MKSGTDWGDLIGVTIGLLISMGFLIFLFFGVFFGDFIRGLKRILEEWDDFKESRKEDRFRRQMNLERRLDQIRKEQEG